MIDIEIKPKIIVRYKTLQDLVPITRVIMQICMLINERIKEVEGSEHAEVKVEELTKVIQLISNSVEHVKVPDEQKMIEHLLDHSDD